MEADQNFEILISKELEDKINWLVNNYDNEIGAWLIGEITNESILIEDFLIPNQDVSGASVDTSGKALVELRKEYGDKCKKIIGHWHSHNTMGNSWSTTDEDFMKEFVAPRERAVFIVSSQSDKHRIRLELTKPFKISLDELEYKIPYEDSKIGNKLKKIISKKCTEKNRSDVYICGKNGIWSETIPTTEKLTKKEVNKMIFYNNKNHNVTIKHLTLNQFYQLELEFPMDQDFFNAKNGKVDMILKTKTRESEIDFIIDIKEFMLNKMEEEEDMIEEDDSVPQDFRYEENY